MSINRNIGEWTVLIVDDAPDNVEVARKVLKFQGAQVYVAADGESGLAKLAEIEKPTFILLDLSMPGMDGWHMLKEMRANPQLENLIVIALTAHAMEGDREKVLKAGFDGYIAKPFRLNSFINSIIECLDQVEQRQKE